MLPSHDICTAQMMSEQFHRDGYILVPGLFATDEIEILRREAECDLRSSPVLTKTDRAGNKVTLKMWADAGDDIYGLVAKNDRIIAIVEKLIGEKIYLYSSKMIMKNARDGGAWEWHQDYGYWYNNGCLMPDMASCMIAVDRNLIENGCLQVLHRSHNLGRQDHIRVGEQFVADPERVEAATAAFERKHIVLEPGDALFFHCNLLHRSDANTSDLRRWSFICSYNAEHNRPFKTMRDYGHGEKLRSVPVDSIRDFAARKLKGGGR